MYGRIILIFRTSEVDIAPRYFPSNVIIVQNRRQIPLIAHAMQTKRHDRSTHLARPLTNEIQKGIERKQCGRQYRTKQKNSS